ncbi:MAG: hypothetical protein LBK70_01870 [Clostridiales bacterium]|jgi:predicted RNA-binding Zn-ribbon protein involved in translation (DUF1610 family)|nr:hypothetical protein [Clostridiales bacterium]
MQDNNTIELDMLPDDEVNIAKCVSCGASIHFDPNLQLLKCDYCGTEINFAKSLSVENISIENLAKNHAKWDKDANAFKCDNCGAIEVLYKTEIAKPCSYCKSTSVLNIGSVSGVKPDSVLPFVFDKKVAATKVESWVGRKFFVPKKFKRSFVPEQLSGVYNPAFVFDSNTFSSYSGSLGKHYTVTVGSGKNRHTVIRTRWFRVSGPYYDRYDNITIQASNNVNSVLMDKLSPFGVEQAHNYNDNYLHGFSANHYHRDGLQCWDSAQRIIHKETRRRLIRFLHTKYNFDVVGSNFRIDTQCYNIGYNYVLLPLYIGHCRYHSKDYNYFVNGHSGKIVGKLPISIGKIMWLVGLGAAALGALALTAMLV